MKIRTKTIKGWANNSDLLFSPNTNNINFKRNLDEFIEKELTGFTRLNYAFDTLKNKDATEKVVIKGWYWRGAWNDPTKETYCIFYK